MKVYYDAKQNNLFIEEFAHGYVCYMSYSPGNYINSTIYTIIDELRISNQGLTYIGDL